MFIWKGLDFVNKCGNIDIIGHRSSQTHAKATCWVRTIAWPNTIIHGQKKPNQRWAPPTNQWEFGPHYTWGWVPLTPTLLKASRLTSGGCPLQHTCIHDFLYIVILEVTTMYHQIINKGVGNAYLYTWNNLGNYHLELTKESMSYFAKCFMAEK